VLFTELKIFQSEPNQLGASQAASNQQRQNRSITLVSQAVSSLFREQGSGLFDGQPVSDPNAQAFCTFNTTDSGSQFWTQEDCIGCLICELSHCR
jgi:hypothetical protein